jgi:Zn-dependent M28 family amino/carboxypeptidase
VCGIVPGTQYPDTVILFIGHYDHLGQLGDDCVFRGAFDNASGTAYVLAFAKYFKQHPLKYTTVYILASGEESGLQGSTYFVNHPLIDLKSIKIVLNFDLLCGGNDGVLFFNGIDTLCAPFLKIMDQVNEKEQIVPKIDKRKNIPNSDHYPFTQKNIPALFALTMGGLKPPTHHPNDVCSSCGFDASENIMRLFIRTLENF